jgi:two-component system response regulator YesN
MGLGFISYVNRLRVQKAIELLLETTLSLSEITQSVGFGSQQYFTRVFKQETGQTPGEYRKASETAETIGNAL